jgi:hypothetical protein
MGEIQPAIDPEPLPDRGRLFGSQARTFAANTLDSGRRL